MKMHGTVSVLKSKKKMKLAILLTHGNLFLQKPFFFAFSCPPQLRIIAKLFVPFIDHT